MKRKKGPLNTLQLHQNAQGFYYETSNKEELIEVVTRFEEQGLSYGPIIIRDLSKEETLVDLMQNNPDLTKEELLYWCPEFKEELPGIKGTQFKVKLSKDQFAGNMTPEQIEDIAKELGFYDSGNIQLVTNNKE